MELRDFEKVANELPASEKLPVFFVGHGSPMNALEDNPFTRSLTALGRSVTTPPKAILVVSAHWLTEGTFVNISARPKTIYDFGNFPRELFQVQYPAPGAPEVAKQVAQIVPHVGLTEEWGLDHGAWTILKFLFPEANIPVFQLSIDFGRPMAYHYELAKHLRSLREKGVLIIASGNVVHSLPLSMKKMMANDPTPYDWAIEFDDWVKKHLHARDFSTLIHYEKAGRAGTLSVPTTDHYIPLLYSLALADEKEPIHDTYEEVVLGGISMRTFRIG